MSSSITTFFAYRYDLLQAVTTWLQGNFALVIKGRYELLYLSVPAVIAAYIYANRFTIAGMGEDFATNLGVNYRQCRQRRPGPGLPGRPRWSFSPSGCCPSWA